jgi:hypothetical protein
MKAFLQSVMRVTILEIFTPQTAIGNRRISCIVQWESLMTKIIFIGHPVMTSQ